MGIISNSEIVRFGIKGILRTIPGTGSIVDLAYSDVRGSADVEVFDVVLLCGRDLDEMCRVAATTKMAGRRTLVLAEELSPDAVRDILRLEADGYLLSSQLDSSVLATAFAQLRDGQVPISAKILRDVLLKDHQRSHAARLRPSDLTARERETLMLLVDGLSNKQIARKLGISVHGVKRLVANIFLKLNCPNRTLAVRTAITLGLTRPTQH